LDSKREIKGKNEEETRYYLLSQNLSAEKALAAIRSHWGIENKVHWILDVAFGEDQCKIRKGNAPQNLAIMRHMALNLLKILKKNTPKLKRISIKQMRKMAGWNAHFLKKILAQTFS
jgi:predicted transposase YbfD/YdcC